MHQQTPLNTTRKSVRALSLPYAFTIVIFFLLSMLQEVIITGRLNWPMILLDFSMDTATITVAFYFFYYLLKRIYASEHKLLSSNNTLSETNYELESFMYRVSHDFRTPLVNLKGLLMAFEYNKKPEAEGKYFSMLRETTEKMDARLLKLMEIATSKNKSVTREEIDVASMINDLIQEVRFTASLNDVNFLVEPGSGITVFTDLTRLKILCRNVLTNAVSYVDQGKESHDIRVSISEDGEKAVIRFWDNGIGISENALPKVFEMFYRGTELSDGSGLGLYIAKTITLRCELRVASMESEWTEICVVMNRNGVSPAGR